MTRLIDADAFKQQLQIVEGFEINKYGNIHTNVNALNIASERSTIDAEPVRHGKWIWKGEDGDSRWMCSECKCKEYVPTCNGVPDIWNYCPNCGCRMDKE